MENKSDYSKIEKDLRSYLSMRYDLLKLELIEKMSKILAVIVLIFVCITLLLAALIYFSFALSYALRDVLGSVIPGFCIIGGFFLIVLAVFIAFRKQILINPLVKVIGDILFPDEEQAAATAEEAGTTEAGTAGAEEQKATFVGETAGGNANAAK